MVPYWLHALEPEPLRRTYLVVEKVPHLLACMRKVSPRFAFPTHSIACLLSTLGNLQQSTIIAIPRYTRSDKTSKASGSISGIIWHTLIAEGETIAIPAPGALHMAVAAASDAYGSGQLQKRQQRTAAAQGT